MKNSMQHLCSHMTNGTQLCPGSLLHACLSSIVSVCAQHGVIVTAYTLLTPPHACQIQRRLIQTIWLKHARKCAKKGKLANFNFQNNHRMAFPVILGAPRFECPKIKNVQTYSLLGTDLVLLKIMK